MDTLENTQPDIQVEDKEIKKIASDFNISWATVIISVLTSLVFSLATLVIYNKLVAPKIYTIKIDEILADHIRSIGASNLPAEQKQQIANKWSSAFDESIKEIYADKNVVLTQQAVVLGGVDYTNQLKKEIDLKMNSKPSEK